MSKLMMGGPVLTASTGECLSEIGNEIVGVLEAY
jgi:hypothetical protein